MLNISGFLEKFKKFDKDKKSQKESVIKIIEKFINMSVDPKSIEIKSGILQLRGSPGLRQEIFMKKEQLMPLLLTEKVFSIR